MISEKEYEILKEKANTVLQAVAPRLEAFEIYDYEYLIDEEGHETLVIGKDRIGCDCNSISAVIDEVIGWLFIRVYCRNRYVEEGKARVEKRIMRYWKK